VEFKSDFEFSAFFASQSTIFPLLSVEFKIWSKYKFPTSSERTRYRKKINWWETKNRKKCKQEKEKEEEKEYNDFNCGAWGTLSDLDEESSTGAEEPKNNVVSEKEDTNAGNPFFSFFLKY